MTTEKPDEITVAEVRLPDGSLTPVETHRPTDDTALNPDKPLVMLFPGFGMGASYYRPFAREMAARGYPVASGELRGQGANTARASRAGRWGYHDLAGQDYPRAIHAAKDLLGLATDHPTVLLTHSMGGQIGALFLARAEARTLNVRGMFGVGSGSPYLPTFPGRLRRRLWVGTVLLGRVGGLLGFWPGKVAGWDPVGYGRQSGKHMGEWRRLALYNTFADLGDADLDYPVAMREVRVPVLLTRFTNDVDSPRSSIEALAQHLPNADVSIEELEGELGHNRWARQPQLIADRFERFLADVNVG